jgi:carbon-monoxide dehydrogenase medium subunit
VADISYGRLDPGRVLLLSHAGLDGVSVDGDTVTIGATTPIDALLALEEHAAALGACARNLADYEIRGQGTVGGNLCVGAGHDVPRGDLQGCLLALDARVRSAGADGERTEPLEDFLANRQDRLVLDVSFDRPAASAFVALEYPHTHEYTVIAVTGARSADGTTRLAATGVAGPGARLRSAEALASDPAAAGAAAVGDVTFADDALASAWYREQTLPVLVRRVLTQLEESS